jgi:Cft2 family RNA processing exonuclease
MESSKLPKKGKYLKYYLLGFADAEGCFNISLKKQKTARFGWVLDPVFHVNQHESNRLVLESFKKTLNCGRIIRKPGQEYILQFVVDNRRQLVEKVLPFFDKLVVKEQDYKVFRDIVLALENKDHSDLHKFKGLVKKAFTMNLGGKQRRYSLEEVMKDLENRILRDHTSDTRKSDDMAHAL